MDQVLNNNFRHYLFWTLFHIIEGMGQITKAPTVICNLKFDFTDSVLVPQIQEVHIALCYVLLA